METDNCEQEMLTTFIFNKLSNFKCFPCSKQQRCYCYQNIYGYFNLAQTDC